MKAKGWFVSTVIMALLGGIVYCMWNYAIRSYYVVIQWIALYGFIVMWINLAKWLGKPPAYWSVDE